MRKGLKMQQFSGTLPCGDIKTFNFFHEHNVPLVLMLVLVKLKILSDRKKSELKIFTLINLSWKLKENGNHKMKNGFQLKCF
jgi:hypothetical protein